MSGVLTGHKISAAKAVLLWSVLLAGCMDARGEDPKPPASRAYMPVEEVPADRSAPALTTDEQSKLKKDLAATRDRQAAAAKAQNNK